MWLTILRRVLLVTVLTGLAIIVLPPRLAVTILLLSVIPALIARKKGRDPVNWWGYGVLLFPVALIAALVIKPQTPEPLTPDA